MVGGRQSSAQPAARSFFRSRGFRLQFLLLPVILLFLSGTGRGEGELRFAALGDFTLENGQVIKDCRLGYRTFGRLNRERSNAVLFPTWLAGTSEDLIRTGYVGPGKLADTERYFVIVVDSFGNGVSSSPSREGGQQGLAFPEFSIRDMVRAQHLFLTRHLELSGLHAVVGISMGGMQAFQWLCSYPGFAGKAVPIMASPRLTAGDLLIMNAELRTIEETRGCPRGDRAAKKILAAVHSYAVRNPGYYRRTVPPAELPSLLAGMEKGLAKYNLDDWAWQLKAIMSQNACLPAAAVPPGTGGRPTKLFVIVARDDMLVNPEPALTFAGSGGGETMELTGGCGHFAFLCEGEKIRAAVNAFLNRGD